MSILTRMPISADAAVRQLQMATAEGVRYIDGGWQTMINALLAVCRAQGVEVQTKATALSVIENGDRVEVTTSTETCRHGRGDRRGAEAPPPRWVSRERPGCG